MATETITGVLSMREGSGFFMAKTKKVRCSDSRQRPGPKLN